jgi:hypothetical protein
MVPVHARITRGAGLIVKQLFHRMRGVLIAFAALALSAGMVLGAQPEASLSGLANASAHAGKTVPVKAGQVEDTTEDEDTDEDVDEDVDDDVDEELDEDVEEEGAEDGTGGENCATDPTTLDEVALAELKHGSIVCWAAHQDEWPAWFTKHGEHVRCWAHHGKADAPSCTEDPDAAVPEVDEDAAATSTGNGKGKGQGKGQGQGKGHNK